MPKICDKCDTAMLPADDMDCEKARWVCPDCAPQFVLMRATTFKQVDCPNDGWNDKY